MQFRRLRALVFVGLLIAAPATGRTCADEVTKPADGIKAAEDAKRAEVRRASAEEYELYQIFADTLDQVERNYVKKVDRRELMEAAIDGVLSKLDPYSNYISPDDIGRFKTSVENQFGGIGIQIAIDHEQLQSSQPAGRHPRLSGRACKPATRFSRSTANPPTACRSTTPSASSRAKPAPASR